jgi:NADP-dependent 3-hydroxy acid dehydrogenase YdfG
LQEYRDGILLFDLTDKNVCKKIVEMSIEKFGKISVLVNSAGVLKTGTLENMKMEDYEDSMEINVKSINVFIRCYCVTLLLLSFVKLVFHLLHLQVEKPKKIKYVFKTE